MDSPILDDIRTAIKARGGQAGTVRISLADNPVLESFEDNRSANVKWLCWSINDAEGVEVLDPQYEICCPTLTAEQIRSDFGDIILGFRFIVDNDIQV